MIFDSNKMAVAPAVIEAKKPAAAEPPEKKPEVIFLSLRGGGNDSNAQYIPLKIKEMK